MRAEDLNDEQIERILQSKIVQKYVAYRSLTDGVHALKEDDGVMYDTFIDGIHRRVNRLARDTVDDVVQAMVEEVEDNTEFIEDIENEDAVIDAATQ